MQLNNKYKIGTTLLLVLVLAGFANATTIRDSAVSIFTGGIDVEDNDIHVLGTTSIAPDTQDVYFEQSVPEAKAGILWNSWDNTTNQNVYSGWLVCHYNSTINSNKHQHCSIETIDNSTGTPSLNSHFAITYSASQIRANITFPQSDVMFISNQKLYFGDTKQTSIEHNSTSGDLELEGNNDLFMNELDLDMNDRDIQNIGDIYSNAQSIDLKSADMIKMFPDGQTSIGLQTDISGSDIIINGLGTTNIIIADNLTISDLSGTGNDFACLDSTGKLYRSATACS